MPLPFNCFISSSHIDTDAMTFHNGKPGYRPISVIPNLEDKTMVVLSPERNKPFKCKSILLFCPSDWELTERGLHTSLKCPNYSVHQWVEFGRKQTASFRTFGIYISYAPSCFKLSHVSRSTILHVAIE